MRNMSARSEMMRPGANEPLANAAHYAMGNYILMPQMAIPGGQTSHLSQSTGQQQVQSVVTSQSASSQSQLTQAQYHRQFQQYQPLQPTTMGQQLILPQMNAFPMQQFPLLQATMMPTQMIATHPAATHLVQHPAYTQRTNKLRPKASENVKLPDPLPDCIEKINQTTDLYCSICELSVNSQQQLTQHLGSTKHKLVSLGLLPKPSEDPNIKRVGQYKCKICDVILNSEAQLVQHLKSLRHQAAERGEELPPRGERRFCPYQVKPKSKPPSQQAQPVLEAELTLQNAKEAAINELGSSPVRKAVQDEKGVEENSNTALGDQKSEHIENIKIEATKEADENKNEKTKNDDQ